MFSFLHSKEFKGYLLSKVFYNFKLTKPENFKTFLNFTKLTIDIKVIILTLIEIHLYLFFYVVDLLLHSLQNFQYFIQ